MSIMILSYNCLEFFLELNWNNHYGQFKALWPYNNSVIWSESVLAVCKTDKIDAPARILGQISINQFLLKHLWYNNNNSAYKKLKYIIKAKNSLESLSNTQLFFRKPIDNISFLFQKTLGYIGWREKCIVIMFITLLFCKKLIDNMMFYR